MRTIFLILTFSILGSQSLMKAQDSNIYWEHDHPASNFSPKHYVCYRPVDSIIIDGIPNEQSWKNAGWTTEFADIRGDDFPAPYFSTKAKILWDDQYLYIAAVLEEHHIQGSITQHDAVVFHDNDFEVFIDPSGDTHLYYELEINALNTTWDLLLNKPYRVGGTPINSLESPGLQSAVHINGTLNNPSDQDSCWYVELALPLKTLSELNNKNSPEDGQQWRLNFSRVQWHTHIENGEYIKDMNAQTGRLLPEENWVWSTQGVVDMHRPETWGFIQFSDTQVGSAPAKFVLKEEEEIKWALRNVFFAQKRFQRETGSFAHNLQQLKSIDFIPEKLPCPVKIKTSWKGYEAMAVTKNKNWIINQDGRVWPSL